MNTTARSFLRLLGFAVALVLAVCFANTFLIQTDAVTAMMMAELKGRDDIQLCVVGSSLSQDHFNTALIEEKTGLRAFSASVNGASLPADIAVTEEMLRTNRPEWIVLVLDSYDLETAKELIGAENRLMPHLTSWRTRLDYYLRLCRQDGDYANRLFLFRTFAAQSFSDVAKTFSMRFDRENAFARAKQSLPEGIAYMGGGYLRYTIADTAQALVRRGMIRGEDPGYTYDLLEPTKEMLLEYAALCEGAGAKLMIAIFPCLTAHALAEPDFLPYEESLMRFCDAQGIPCFNFTYARESFLPNLDEYFFDLHHMNADGADRFSLAFSELFNRFVAGEDVSSLFYASRAEYLASIDFITNVWLAPQDGTTGYIADCNRGSEVAPEYRFCLVAQDGGETPLRDYAPDAAIAADIPQGANLRVYARPQGDAAAAPVYYDYPDDAMAAAL